MSDYNSEGAAEEISAEQPEPIHKYVAPISGGRRLYFYTFGEEELELPPGSVLEVSREAVNV